MRRGNVFRLELPNVGDERTFLFYQLFGALCVVDDSFYFSPVPHDTFILQQASNISFCKFGNFVVVEAMKCLPKILSLRKYGAPTQPRLKPLKA